MEFVAKFLSLLLLVASTLAQYEDFHGLEGHGVEGHGLEGYHFKQPVHQSLDENHDDYDLDYHAHPKYAFDYSVKDPHTGDDKEHWETRDGDKVKGTYTLVETDGTKRVVEYEADDKNGFNAVVHKIGKPIELEEIKVVKKHYEPLEYQHSIPEYQHFDEGFMPMSGGLEH